MGVVEIVALILIVALMAALEIRAIGKASANRRNRL